MFSVAYKEYINFGSRYFETTFFDHSTIKSEFNIETLSKQTNEETQKL